MKSLKVAV
jgi:hypothetical protein